MGIVEQLIKEKKEKDALNIRSREDLISACDAEGIPKEWYSFTYSDTALVCKSNDTIYYGNHGATTNSKDPDSLYASMFYELMRYKKTAEREAQGLPYELLGIEVKLHNSFKKDPDKEYPYVISQATVLNEKDVEDKVALGWEKLAYDWYMAWYYMQKVEDIRNLIKNIVIRFNKKTTDEDRALFGFSDDYMIGSYSYEVPAEMREEIAKSLFDNNGAVNKEVKDKIFSHFSDVFIQDEFIGLSSMKNDFERAIAGLNREIGQTYKQVEDIMLNQFKEIWFNNPAKCNYSGSRSIILEDFYYDKAYEKLKLVRDPRTGRKCDKDWKSFLHNN